MKENLNSILLVLVLIGVGVNTYMLTDKNETSAETASAIQSPSDPHGHVADANNPAPVTPEVTTPVGPTTQIRFAESNFDFGNIKQDTKNTHTFKFTNTGKEPLIIQNAAGSCGCTVPLYPKEPIAPGGTGEIVVEYSPGKQQGLQNKTVTITANTDPAQTLLNISANVEVAAQ